MCSGLWHGRFKVYLHVVGFKLVEDHRCQNRTEGGRLASMFAVLELYLLKVECVILASPKSYVLELFSRRYITFLVESCAFSCRLVVFLGLFAYQFNIWTEVSSTVLFLA